MERSRIDDLYGLPLGEFTGARDALAKEARAEGDRELAREIKSARKPSVAAWAVNQLARRRGDDIERLLALGTKVRDVQRRALAGRDRGGLQHVMAERRTAVDDLVDEAGRLLREAGQAASRATLDDVTATLLATSTDEVTAERVRRGVLEREASAASGFEDLVGLLGEDVREAEGESRRPAVGDEVPEIDAAALARLHRLRERAADAEAEARAASEEAARLREDADRQVRRAEEAARQAERAAKAADAAEARASRLRQKAQESRDRAEEAAAPSR